MDGSGLTFDHGRLTRVTDRLLVTDLLLAPELDEEVVRRLLHPYGLRDWHKADLCLQQIAGDPDSRQKLTAFLPELLREVARTADPDGALVGLERFLSAVSHRRATLSILRDDPKALSLLMRICGGSPFLVETLLREPEYFYVLRWELEEPDCLRQSVREEFSRVWESRGATEQRLHQVRRGKRRHLLRIAAADLMDSLSIEAVMHQLSDLADAVVEAVCRVQWDALGQRYGAPPPSVASPGEMPFCVIGLGKLGGQELNFSSDIDLLFLYEREEGRTRGPRVLSAREFFIKLAQEITQALSAGTGEGSLYRVDLRLRPGGEAGVIAQSVQAYQTYYENWGETPDRLALLKGRVVAGNRALGESFLSRIHPFIYPKHLDYGALEEIRDLKERIDQQRIRRGGQRDIKRGLGGIREIEFFVQTLQLIFGGRRGSLQARSTLEALERLREAGWIDVRQQETLRQAYRFLRDLEHKLQVVQGSQTHALPDDPLALQQCARRLGFGLEGGSDPAASLLDRLDEVTGQVHAIYRGLLVDPHGPTLGGEGNLLRLVRDPAMGDEEALEILAGLGFRQPRQAHHHLELLSRMQGFSQNPARLRRDFVNLAPVLLEALGRSPDPDMGLGFFVNFVEGCGSIESRYELFVRHPELLERLLLLFTGSELFSRGLVEAPHLFDAGLASPWDPESLAPPAMRDRWKRVSSGVEDPEEVLVALRRFRRLEELRVALAEISGWVAVPQAQRALTTLAELCLNTGLELAVELSAPPESRKGLPDFAILGLGSLATGEFSYHSDLDLVCVSSREGKPRTVRTLFRQLHRVLSAHLDGGPLYKVDWRLRPEGKEGPLVVSFDHYRTYLHERLDIWERVALLKSRCVAGDATLAGELEKLVRQAAYDTGLPAGWLAEMDHIRQRMEKEIGQEHLERWHLKVGAGALADIEFGVRYLQLVHGRARPELRQVDLPGALRALQQGGVVEKEEGEFLSEALQFLRVLAHRSRFLFGPEGEIVPREGLAVAKLVFLMQRLGEWGPGEPWETRYGEVTSRVRQWYRKVVEGLS